MRIAPAVWSTLLKCPPRVTSVETSAVTRPCMSASLPKADIRELVRLVPLADITRPLRPIALPLRHAAPTARRLRVAGSGDRKETTVHWQHYRGWRAPLPRRKSTNPPANSCDGEVTLCGSNCWRLRFSLENRSTLIPAVTADLPGLLRPAACVSEIAVIEPPYALDERRVAPFTLTHNELNSLRRIDQPR